MAIPSSTMLSGALPNKVSMSSGALTIRKVKTTKMAVSRLDEK